MYHHLIFISLGHQPNPTNFISLHLRLLTILHHNLHEYIDQSSRRSQKLIIPSNNILPFWSACHLVKILRLLDPMNNLLKLLQFLMVMHLHFYLKSNQN